MIDRPDPRVRARRHGAIHALGLALCCTPALGQPTPAVDPTPTGADPCAVGVDEKTDTGAFSRQSGSRKDAVTRQRQAICREVAPFAGQPIGAVDVRCDVDVCTDPERRAVLVRVAGLVDGAPLDPRAVSDAWFRLQRTAYFRDVRVAVESGEGGVQVAFDATAHVVITDLDVEYVGWESRFYPQLFRTEIRKRLPLRKGGSFPPGTPDGGFSEDDRARIDDWEDRVVSLYDQLGFVGTRVAIEPTYHGPNNTLVRVVVRVDEGRQPEIGEILVRGNEAFPYWRVVQPLATGERVDVLRDIFAIFGIGRYARRQLKDELEQVEAAYREAGFVTARARLESPFARKGARVYPRVRVREGPALIVRFEGNESIDDEELAALTTFAENGAIDATEIEASRVAIIDAYQAIARFDVRVEPEIVETNRERTALVFQITEGRRIYARRIELVGNRQLDDETIFEAMETRGIAPDGVINAFGTSAGVLQDGRLINDLLAIRGLYRDRGFSGIRFRCGDPNRVTAGERNAIRAAAAAPVDEMGPAMGPAITRLHDIWTDDPVKHLCYEVLPDPDPRLVVVRIELSEGKQSTVDGLDMDTILAGFGDEARDEAYDLLQELGFVDDLLRWRTAGVNGRKLDAVRGFLLRQWHRQGYLDAQVTPRCDPPPRLPRFRPAIDDESDDDDDAQTGPRMVEVVEDEPSEAEPDDGHCTDQNLYGTRLDTIRLDSVLRAQVQVDGILLQGNLRTDSDIIDAELLFSDGGPLGTDQLFRSQANLRSLGVFDAVQMETITDEKGTGNRYTRDAAVMITVEESDYQFADLFVGLQIDSTPIDEELPVLYSVGGSIRDRNLLGRALEVGAGLNFINRLDAPFTIGEYDETVFEAGPFLKDRRLFGTRLDLTVEATYKMGRTSQRDAYEQVIDFRPTVGYDFYNLSYPNDWGRGLRATLVTDYRIEQRRALIRSTGEVPLFGDATQSVTLEPTVTWDRRDSPLHPTRGGVLLASVEVVFNAFNRLENLVLEPSFKQTLTAQYVQSFFERQLIVVPALRLGWVQTDQSEADLKSGFFFKAGGDGVALPVRGYADAVIEACGGVDDDTSALCAGVIPDGATTDDALVDSQRIGGKAMMLGSVEARFPTFIIDDFWWSIFSDVGAVAPDWGSMTATRFFPSVGAGLRWLVTGQVPLRLDLAYPLRQDPFEDQTLRVHLNIFYPL